MEKTQTFAEALAELARDEAEADKLNEEKRTESDGNDAMLDIEASYEEGFAHGIRYAATKLAKAASHV